MCICVFVYLLMCSFAYVVYTIYEMRLAVLEGGVGQTVPEREGRRLHTCEILLYYIVTLLLHYIISLLCYSATRIIPLMFAYGRAAFILAIFYPPLK